MSFHNPILRLLRSLLLSNGLLLGVLLASGQAQVTTPMTPDATLGTAVTQSGTVHDITAAHGLGAGPICFIVLTSVTGQGGNVAITATDFVAISGRAGAFPSGVSTETSGSGNAGHIALSTPILTMEDGRISSATTGDGRAGDLMLHVGRLTLAGGAQISSASGSNAGAVGSGRGGDDHERGHF